MDLCLCLTGNKLEQICASKKLSDGRRTIELEAVMQSSGHAAVRQIISNSEWNKPVNEIMKDLLQYEQFSTTDPNSRVIINLQKSLERMKWYRDLISIVESNRCTTCSSENIQHENLLLELWKNLKPEELLRSRTSPQWTEVGFQGEDPMTDFRGMGLLALLNLIYFTTTYPQLSRSLVKKSHHPKLGYSFAIVGINMTELAYNLLVSGQLKRYFYNALSGPANLDHFHQIYAYLLMEFHKFWFKEKPENIMLFNKYRLKFQKMIRKRVTTGNFTCAIVEV